MKNRNRHIPRSRTPGRPQPAGSKIARMALEQRLTKR